MDEDWIKSKKVLREVSTNTSPVSTSVMLTLYCLIMPFWSSVGGGSQDILIEVELVAVRLTSSGGPLGAILEI